MRDDRERLLDIWEAIEEIEEYPASSKEIIERDALIRVWLLYHLQIIGEAARGLSEGFIAAHTEVPWSQIVGMRNILVHHYFGVDVDVLWEVLQTGLPDLKAKMAIILQELGEHP